MNSSKQPGSRINKVIPPLKQKIEELNDEYNDGIILKMIDDNNTIIGSVRAKIDSGTVHIGKLMVHPDHQHKGYGKDY